MIATPPVLAGPAYVLDEQVGFVLRQVQQRHAAIFAAAFGEDFTPMQWAALARLAERGECSQNRLGRLISTDVATIKGLVERLVRRGFASTRPDVSDRRRILVAPTAAGLAAFRGSAATAVRVTDDTLAPLGREERATLLSLLERLR